jgi:hypothetical protein
MVYLEGGVSTYRGDGGILCSYSRIPLKLFNLMILCLGFVCDCFL